MKIKQKTLYKLYTNEVDKICILYPEKKSFSTQEIIAILSRILEGHPELIEK